MQEQKKLNNTQSLVKNIADSLYINLSALTTEVVHRHQLKVFEEYKKSQGMQTAKPQINKFNGDETCEEAEIIKQEGGCSIS